MIKRLHFLMMFLLLAGVASAQKWQTAAVPGHLTKNSRVVEVDEEHQMWWGYYTKAQNLVGLGFKAADTYWGAIGIPRSQTLCQGKSIRAVRFIVAGTQYMKDFSLWFSETLPTESSSNYTKIPVAMSQINENAMTEIELETPYPIPAKTLYVGMTFTITEAEDGKPSQYPMIINYDGTDVPNALWIRATNNLPTWTDPSTSESGYGELAMQVLLEGEFPRNAVSVSSSFTDAYALVNGSVEVPLTLTSRGLGEVSNIDYTVTDANGTSEERHLEFTPFSGMDATRDILIPLNGDATSGRTARTITVTKVNGVENGISNAVAKGYVVSLSQSAEKKTVVEEFTGTWCGWCPKGITGLEQVNEHFKDRVITIAVHGDDPMEINYGINAPSYPYGLVDRTTVADPYFGRGNGIVPLVEDCSKVLSEAALSLSEPVLAKDGRITFKTDVLFNYSSTTAPYALGYVLLANGLKGEGKSWWQANYFSHNEDYQDDEGLRRWYEAESYVHLTYDHVAVAAKGMNGGLSGSIKAPIQEGVAKTVNGNITITNNAVLQGFDDLSVVVVLFNTLTGAIVNADVRPVTVADDFPVNSAQMGAFDRFTVVKGETGAVPVPVANYGKAGIKSLDYVVRAGVKESESRHIDLTSPITSFGVPENVLFTVDAEEESGIVNRSIAITKVNGEENEATANRSASGRIMTIAKESPRKTVVEEYTGTWCMWCMRGWAGLKRAHDEYPDDAVLMAIHSGSGSTVDPMQAAVFSSLISGHSFPSAEVNRYRSVDPYFGEGSGEWGLGAVIDDEQSRKVEAAVNLSQPLWDEEAGTISFVTDVTFQINRRNAPYLLSYVLIADGLTGSGDGWTQVNAYTAYAGYYDNDPYLKEITEMPTYIDDMVYDHVAINGLGVVAGVAGSLKNKVEEGQVQSHSAQFSVKNSTLAKSAEKLYVAALLYDKEAKMFINADKKEVVKITDGIDRISSDEVVEVARYTADGKRISHPEPGINLVRLSNGQVRKVFVK